jgi:hypothetical protein
LIRIFKVTIVDLNAIAFFFFFLHDRELQQFFIFGISLEMAVDLASALPTSYTTSSSKTNISSFCRICATADSSNLFSIFSQEGELWDVVEKIGRCLPIIVRMIGRISVPTANFN